MKNRVPKISYDRESEVLSIEVKKVKSVDSDMHGNLVVDYDKQGNIARINFYGFSFDAFKASAQRFFPQFSRGNTISLTKLS